MSYVMINIVTRTTGSLSHQYEYPIFNPARRFHLDRWLAFLPFYKIESDRFADALQRIADGKNQSDWILTEPSKQDIGMVFSKICEMFFYKQPDIGAPNYCYWYFANETVRNQFLFREYKRYYVVHNGEHLLGRPVFDIKGAPVNPCVDTDSHST